MSLIGPVLGGVGKYCACTVSGEPLSPMFIRNRSQDTHAIQIVSEQEITPSRGYHVSEAQFISEAQLG